MKHTDQIEKIKKVAKDGGKEFGAANALGEFSVLLGTLAEDADKAAEKNTQLAEDTRNLTKELHTFTKVLIGLAIIQIVVAVLQFVYPFVHTPKNSTGAVVQTNGVVK